MNVLICVASKHQGTQEIAARIRDVLARELGDANVEVRRLEDVVSVCDYDAVVVGSAVYVGRWLRPAERFVKRNSADLSTRPVWLFSSGPVGQSAPDDSLLVDTSALQEEIQVRGYRVFGGRLDRSRLAGWERVVVAGLKIADNDLRDWAAIEGWATEIATELRAERATAPPGAPVPPR